LAWIIKYTDSARKQLKKLDRQSAQRILDFMDDRIAKGEHPREIGKGLTGTTLGAFWRYRVGDYRIICDIQEHELLVIVVQLGNRKDIYR
jgi:mRNA interferase RelE/StbE